MEKFKLNLKDKKILSLIEVNARLSYAKIGKEVGLSKQVVKYRMDNLEKHDIIQEYYAIINNLKLNQDTHIVYLQLADLSKNDENKLINLLEKDKRVLSYFSSLGNWDLVIAISTTARFEINFALQNILSPIASKIKNKVITTQAEFSYLTTKTLSNIGKNTSKSVHDKSIKVDEIDFKIIKELTKNARISLVDLSSKLSMTPNGAKERIKNLTKKGVITGYKTKINYELLGFIHAHFFVWARNMDLSFYDKFKSFLILDGRAETISRFFGYADIDFRCNVKSAGELYGLKRKIKNHFKDEVNSIESLIVVRSGVSHLKKS